MDGGLQTSSEHTHILQQGITKNQMCAHREPVSEKKKNQICKYIMLHLSLRAPPSENITKICVVWKRDPEAE